jgi:HEAT repeat protein
MKATLAICVLVLCVGLARAQEPIAQAPRAQEPIDGVDARSDAAEFTKQLASTDPLLRQRSAEALARLAAVKEVKLVEGYQLQEKNKEVRLALDWALYRMGRSEALYRIVADLDSGRQEQAIGYLSQLEAPDVLYPFLNKEKNKPRVTAGLLKALARTGDAHTLEIVTPYRESQEPFVAEAAEIAHDEIEKRLSETAQPTRSRPRSVGDRP